MEQIKNPLELYAHLDKSNCRACLLPSCMAFAVAVIQGHKQLSDCPALTPDRLEQLSGCIGRRQSLEQEQDKLLARVRARFAQQDLHRAARRLNAPVREEQVGVSCLGKYFWIDAQGNMRSECHTNAWVHGPILHWLLSSRGLEPSGEWIAFSAIQGAGPWENFFAHRCEQEMTRLARTHTDLFFDILELFEAKEVQGVSDADRSLVLHPLPLVPFLFNYREAEEPFPAQLNILFDATASANTDAESVYALARGMVEMFGRLIARHTAEGRLF